MTASQDLANTPSSRPRLRAQDLEHRFGDNVLFRDLSIEFVPGTIYAIIGRNGSGKSTLLRRLAAIEAPQRGTVHLDGFDLAKLSARKRARSIAFLPQQTPLYHDLTVRELVQLGRLPHLGPFAVPAAADLDTIDLALEQVGLGSFANRRISTLSGGEQKRTMLARMLATAAPVFILDEPCAALDVAHAIDFLQLCRQLAKSGATIILALHELQLVRSFADRVLCLGVNDGGVCSGPTTTVLDPKLLRDGFGVEVDMHGGMAFSSPTTLLDPNFR